MDLMDMPIVADQVILVDFSWLTYRSYYAFEGLSVEIDGQVVKTGTMYGTLRDINQILETFPLALVVVITEGLDPDDRNVILPEYKGTRTEKLEVFELRDDTLSALANFPRVHFVRGVRGEADDAIGIMARWAVDEGARQVFIHSKDNDMLQIPRNLEDAQKIGYLDDGRFVPFGEFCQKKYGVPCHKILLYRSVLGDGSDNIPRLIDRFPRKLLKEIVDHIDHPYGFLEDGPAEHFTCKWSIALENKINDWLRNYEVMRLRYDTPLLEFFPEPKDAMYFVNRYKMRSALRFFSTDSLQMVLKAGGSNGEAE